MSVVKKLTLEQDIKKTDELFLKKLVEMNKLIEEVPEKIKKAKEEREARIKKQEEEIEARRKAEKSEDIDLPF